MQREMHPESQSMSEVGGEGGENVFYSWSFLGDTKYPQNAIITRKGGTDYNSQAFRKDTVFVNRSNKWWAVDFRDPEQPTLREAREDELESIEAFIRGAICVKV